jgi:hypothetical protein
MTPNMADPFSRRIFGPEGWTDRMVELLEPWFTTDGWGGLREFVGVPADVAAHVARELADAQADTVEGPAASVLVDAARLLGDGATVSGRAVDSARGDERVEFATVQADIKGWDDSRVDAAVAAVEALGLECIVERGVDHQRLVAG